MEAESEGSSSSRPRSQSSSSSYSSSSLCCEDSSSSELAELVDCGALSIITVVRCLLLLLETGREAQELAGTFPSRTGKLCDGTVSCADQEIGRKGGGGGRRGGDLRHWKWLELGIITLHSRQSAGRESEQRRIFRANCVSGRRRGNQFLFCPVGDRFNWAKGDIRRCAWSRRTGGAGERPWLWWLRAGAAAMGGGGREGGHR